MPAPLAPTGIFSTLEGTPQGTPFTQLTIGTGIALNNNTRFLPLHIRAYITDVGGGFRILELSPKDEFIRNWWRDALGPWVVARNSWMFFDPDLHGLDFSQEMVAPGLLCDTSATYDVSDIVPMRPGDQVTALFFLMRMYA